MVRQTVQLLLAFSLLCGTGCDRQASRLATQRGSQWGLAWDEQLLYFDSAIELDPENTLAYAQRGIIRAQNGLYELGLADLQHAVELDQSGEFPGQTYNNLAWMMATCHDEKCRDGKKAVGFATKACEFTNWEDAGLIDTLAAAYAEAGDFPEAIRWQKKAFELSKDFVLRGQFVDRLELYRQGKAYRE